MSKISFKFPRGQWVNIWLTVFSVVATALRLCNSLQNTRSPIAHLSSDSISLNKVIMVHINLAAMVRWLHWYPTILVKSLQLKLQHYHQTSNISHTLVENKIVDHSDVVGASPVGCSNYTFILDLTPGFNGLGKDNCKTRWETFQFWDLVQLILEVWQYVPLEEKWSVNFSDLI